MYVMIDIFMCLVLKLYNFVINIVNIFNLLFKLFNKQFVVGNFYIIFFKYYNSESVLVKIRFLDSKLSMYICLIVIFYMEIFYFIIQKYMKNE